MAETKDKGQPPTDNPGEDHKLLKFKPGHSETLSLSAKKHERRPYLVELPIFFYFLAYKGALPLKEQFLYSLLTTDLAGTVSTQGGLSPSCVNFLNASANVSSSSIQLEVTLQEDSAALLSVLNIVRNAPALFATLILCSYTDVIGRRWGIFLPCIGGALKTICFLIVAYVGMDASPLLYIGETLEGFGGSIMTAQNIAAAYVSDIITEDKRTFRFTIIQSLHYLGTAIGNVIIGYAISGFGYCGSFGFILALYLACAFWVYFMLPESLQDRSDRPFSVLAVLQDAIFVFRIYVSRNRPTSKKIILVAMLVAVLMDNIIILGRTDVDTLFFLAVPFCWTSIIIGYFQLLKYTFKAVFGLSVKCWANCVSDAIIATGGALFGMGCQILQGLATVPLELWIVGVVGAPSGVILPMAQSIMSKTVEFSERGPLFASLGVVEGASDMFAGSVLDIIYSATYDKFPGTVFLVIAGLYFVATVCCLTTWSLLRKPGNAIAKDIETSPEVIFTRSI
ncbi:hypothetical protein CAPTEDRAFT_198722 [Capitella teleta]|uniref:Major facilitator superfamily (MFS) profile domain-containing protein n=1 Tax=Capitella teleta TaxID=283909 RepID=R7V352_CAPTE|nr:hypothetical protein CAPTEDRAFT_198722 [Capitella teleta]|eukprot:ELU12922.1 hypothetical protein CAPTEDRAFT_198722 [Capitella teleta]